MSYATRKAKQRCCTNTDTQLVTARGLVLQDCYQLEFKLDNATVFEYLAAKPKPEYIPIADQIVTLRKGDKIDTKQPY